jgi:hypothetical protein
MKFLNVFIAYLVEGCFGKALSLGMHGLARYLSHPFKRKLT